MQEVDKNSSKVLIRSQWNGLGGNGIIVALLRDPDFRQELGVSNEQYERIQEVSKDRRDPQKNPELNKIYEEIKSIEAAHGTTLQNADEETKKKYFDLNDKVTEMTITVYSDDGLSHYHVAYALEKTLTQEQKQRMKELQLAASLSDVSIFPPSMFEALDLTDAQKQEMEAIKARLESELEKPLEDLAKRQRMVDNKIWEECEKKGYEGIDFSLLDEVTLKQIKEDMGKIANETQSYGTQYAKQFKTEMFDVLTDEQWARLQNMIDNPSGLVKTMQKKMKEWKENKGAYTPGPNSWQPGDPIPEEYRQQRNERQRFPR
jgi:Ni/Co efflux regulator RcnB